MGLAVYLTQRNRKIRSNCFCFVQMAMMRYFIMEIGVSQRHCTLQRVLLCKLYLLFKRGVEFVLVGFGNAE